MSVNIRIEKSGATLDIEPRDPMAIWYVLEQAGVITYPPKKTDKKLTQPMDSRWWVTVDTKGIPAVISHCDHCGAHQVFLEGEGARKPDEWGTIPPSTLVKAKIEHCRRTNFIPYDVLQQFRNAQDGVNR